MHNRSWPPVAVAIFLSVQAWAEKNPKLPEPYATPSVENFSKVIGWPEGKTPIAAPGFEVSLLANIESPRLLYQLPSGDVLVSQAKKKPSDQGEESPNQITRLHFVAGEFVAQSIFAKDLTLPFGMALWKDQFFVSEPTRILKYKFKNEKLEGAPKVIAELPFPAPQRHWTRFLLLNDPGTKLYVSVGSVSNAGESPDPLDPKTAAILEMNLDGSEQKIVASGIRNAVSLAWEPYTHALWAVVNERDELGDGLVPDYITHVVRGGFYGWPYAYWGKHLDPRLNGARPDLVQKSITPDFSVGAHTASLGITFTAKTKLPAPFHRGALISQHGSWNSSSLQGYKVSYVPFVKGQAMNGEKDFLTGFIAEGSKDSVYGRPVSSVVLKDGTVLIADDAGNKIWRISPSKARP